MGIKSVLILGATGRIGRLVVEQALHQGFAVTALVRQPEKLGHWLDHPNLEVLHGSLLL